jgi:hypothetical protein
MSPYFNRDNASLFMSFGLSDILLLDSNNIKSIYEKVELLQLYLNSISDLNSTSESESRTNNATKAEVWSGLLRAYFIIINNNDNYNINKNEIENIFLQFLITHIDKNSMDYSKDWSEAIFFAFNIFKSNPQNIIPNYILENFKQSLLNINKNDNINNNDNITNNNSNNNSEEGFAKLFCTDDILPIER